jgi:serine/threonine protein kinase
VLGVNVLPVNIAIYFIQEVTVAMSHIHEAGYLHRDVKPENMLVRFQSDEDFKYLCNQEIPEKDRLDRLDSLIPAKIRIVLTDFGLVRKYIGTVVGTFAGSPKYMSKPDSLR